MIDALKQENFLVGSTYSDFVSGMDAQLGTATITTSTLTTANVTTLSAVNLKAGSAQLSSGSRWVVFGNAFGDTKYHATCSANAGIAAEPYSVIGTGSKAAGSFIAVGSPAAAVFDWVAIPRQG